MTRKQIRASCAIFAIFDELRGAAREKAIATGRYNEHMRSRALEAALAPEIPPEQHELREPGENDAREEFV